MYSRFGIYYLPPATSALAVFGAQWLGWDVATGAPVEQPDLPQICDITMTPRKYGFHATLKPPFRLATGLTPAALQEEVAALAASVATVQVDGLQLAALGRFLALVPQGDVTELNALAARLVRSLDGFRAPLTEAELTYRRGSGLTPEQEANLLAWGYPHVMEAFRFHMTLTGKLSKPQRRLAETALAELLPSLPSPFAITEIALVGERPDGMFETVHRYALTG